MAKAKSPFGPKKHDELETDIVTSVKIDIEAKQLIVKKRKIRFKNGVITRWTGLTTTTTDISALVQK